MPVGQVIFYWGQLTTEMYWPTGQLDSNFFPALYLLQMLSNRKDGLQPAHAEQVLLIPVGGFAFLFRTTGKHVLDTSTFQNVLSCIAPDPPGR